MNHLSLRRIWLVYRSDLAAALGLVAFMISAFWGAGHLSALLLAMAGH